MSRLLKGYNCCRVLCDLYINWLHPLACVYHFTLAAHRECRRELRWIPLNSTAVFPELDWLNVACVGLLCVGAHYPLSQQHDNRLAVGSGYCSCFTKLTRSFPHFVSQTAELRSNYWRHTWPAFKVWRSSAIILLLPIVAKEGAFQLRFSTVTFS